MEGLTIRIERSNPLPIHTQLVEQLRHLVVSGVLAGGARLPTVRELARLLGVNRNTVQRAYRDLEQARLLEARAGKGTYVARLAGESAERQRAYRRLRALLHEILDLGFSPPEIAAMVQAEATRLAFERARQAEGLASSRQRFATWGRYRSRGSGEEPRG